MHALKAVRREIQPSDSARGRKYLREFTQAFRAYEAVLAREELDERIEAADILLVGDYHALPQSSRFAATLLRRLAATRPVMLGLEAVLSRDQAILDSWWRREIQEEELRARLRFDRDWGYEWTPFYELLMAAREQGEGISGLDSMPRNDLRRIRSRDRHAALKISEMRAEHPRAAIVVLFGESHLAPQHLPATLRRVLPQARVLTILQNVDALYWRAVIEQASAVSVSRDTVCVFNSSPLEKYESYRLCLERWGAGGDDVPDFAPAVYNLIFSLARGIGVRLDLPSRATKPRYLADLFPEVIALAEFEGFSEPGLGGPTRGFSARKRLSSGLGKTLAERLERQGCIYDPATNMFLIGEFRIAAAAAEATRFLARACRGMSALESSVTTKIDDALAYFGSRLLCPEAREEGSGNVAGEALYRAYVERRITKNRLRKIFSTRLENREEVRRTLATIARLC
ncbi:MAG: ChaN family lipoprotein [Acidobacteria bacterium]|nr:ChaN family lipoprotein [Acidobacteriota bacterium]MBV9625915.1 ChaN family lipoprotein [Acidobacteriota bacterium]